MRVRGDAYYLERNLAMTRGTEEVGVLLGGVPYTARVLIPAGSSGFSPDEEWVVLQESVGDPLSTATGTASAYFERGMTVLARDTGERDAVSGRRVVEPVDPNTGEPPPAA